MPSNYDVRDPTYRERLMRERAMLSEARPAQKWAPDPLEPTDYHRGGNAMSTALIFIFILLCVYAAGYLIFFR